MGIPTKPAGRMGATERPNEDSERLPAARGHRAVWPRSRGVSGGPDPLPSSPPFCTRGSGIRWLIDQRLQEAKVKPNQLKGYDTEVWTHWKVGLNILRRQADAGVAAEAVARLFGLAFRAVVEERFDLLVLKEHYFTKPVQALLEALTSSDLNAHAGALGGYDVRNTGKVVFPL